MASSSEIDQMIKNGQSDTREFAEALLLKYSGYIRRLATSILGDPDEAEDIVQETFIEALVHINRYEPGTNLKAWLSQIAVNKCKGLLRKRRLRSALQRTIQNIQTILQNPTSEAVVQAERKSEVWSAVNALNDKHRIPVILYYVYGLKVREIAAILEIPEGTVSSRLHYALRKLGAYLQDLAED
jgi:RNA polymerase sigma-70 factor (ECF subfamily)